MITTLLTVSLYIVVYSTAILVFKAADSTKSEAKKKRIVVCGIIFMALFACMRDISVGTDTAETISLYFADQYERNIALDSIEDLLHGDVLYFVIANIIHLFHLGSKTFLFVLELCVLSPVAICAYIKRDRIPIHITMLIFSLLYYQLTFNWIRQSAASAFILLTLVYAQNKAIKRAIITAILAVLFHSSAIIGLTLLLFAYTFMRIKNKYLRTVFGVGFMAVFLILLLQWETIVSFGVSYGILPARYEGYLRVFSGQTTVESWFRIGTKTYVDYFLRIAIVMVPIVLSKKNLSLNEQQNVSFYKIIGIIGLIIYSYIFF